MKMCQIPECPNRHHSNGLCRNHNYKNKRYGDPLHSSFPTKCGVEECDRGHYGKGFCEMHYTRYRKHGDPNSVAWVYGGKPKRVRQELCSVCNAPIVGRRIDAIYCSKECYWRKYMHKTAELSAVQLAELHGNTCALCGDAVDMSLKWPDVLSGTVDHIVPRAQGGTDKAENLQLAHFRCNRQKWMHYPAEGNNFKKGTSKL